MATTNLGVSPTRGRPSPISDPVFAKKVAEAFSSGLSRAQMCDLFGVKDHDTITRWRRDPRIKSHLFKLIEDRVLEITRKVDAKLAQVLHSDQELTVQELLAIRKEFLGGALRAQTENAVDDQTIGEASGWLEANPEAAAALTEMLRTGDAQPASDG